VRVLFVCMHLKTGGVERQWSILAPKLHSHGFDVRMLTLRAEGEFFAEVAGAGVAAHCADMRGAFDIRGLRRALAFARPTPDIVMSNSPLAELVGHLIAARTGAAHVTAEHTCSQQKRLRQRVVQRLLARRVDGCVAVTPRQIPLLLERGHRRERITIVPSGVPDLKPSRARSEMRARLGLAEDEFAAFLIATLRPEKRPDFFVEAVMAAHRVDPRIRGFIAGRGPLREHVESRAAASGGAVQALGDRSDVPELLGAADAVCLTSSLEALPMIVIEAMAAGRAVVATAVGGMPDLVVDGETGDLVAPESPDAFARALVALAADPSRRRSYEESASRRHRALFTVERMRDSYAELFRRVAHQAQPASARPARAA
jgi:glycosyltransferase involved in cell wall biosynthesis